MKSVRDDGVKLVAEVDGPVHTLRREADATHRVRLREMGWTTIVVTTGELAKKEHVVALLAAALHIEDERLEHWRLRYRQKAESMAQARASYDRMDRLTKAAEWRLQHPSRL